ncbi:MAG: L-aspartate oxidase [Puniceicoccaceae bacterium]
MSDSFDAVVIGSGIAGLFFSLKAAERGLRVCIVTKKERAESNTNYAQGGIACVTAEGDDFDLHVKDTLEAGDGLCEEEVVRRIVQEGPAQIAAIIKMGVDFSRLDDGRVSLGKEGGHSKRRILHVQDLTGKAIEEALLAAIAAQERIDIREHWIAIDFITTRKLKKYGLQGASQRNRVVGLYALDARSGEVVTVRAGAIMVATGGIGQVYQYTTNPPIATGDGIAMAYRAGAEIRNLEFIQFHPTAFYSPEGDRFLVSEAVRGEGAILRNLRGEAFMRNYHARADLAPRDVVARAIDAEMKHSGAAHVWLDLTVRTSEEINERFPSILGYCLKRGIDPAKEYIPVVPAAHYLCGGVRTELDSRTTVDGLFACGEAACTGLHGANRLASNSLLEALVLAGRGAGAVERFLAEDDRYLDELPGWQDGNVQDSDERVILAHNWEELRRTMWDFVGIVRTTKRLERARTRVRMLAKEVNEYYWNFKVEPFLIELRNMLEVASLVIECALQRKESRGLHYTLDYPEKLPVAEDSVI